MLRRWITAITTILLSLVLVACTTTTTQTIDTEKKVAERVISLTSLSSDIIYRLDKTKLVGITGSSLLDKDSRFKDIAKVSQEQAPPNLEKIVALKPDLVIASTEFHSQLLPKLKDLGITTLDYNIKKWDDLAKITKNIGEAIGVDSASLLASYDNLLGKPVNETRSTLLLVSNKPILAPNKDSWAGDLLAKFGVKNVAADLQGKSPFGGYVTLSAEKVLEANPEVILLINSPMGSVLDEFKSESFWSKLKATQNNQIHVFDYYGLVNPGSLDKIQEACQKLTEVFDKKQS